MILAASAGAGAEQGAGVFRSSWFGSVRPFQFH